MLQNTYYFLLGLTLGLIFVLVCFGYEIKEKSTPKIKLNYRPFIIDSHIMICNKHLHHWFIQLTHDIFTGFFFQK